MSLNFTGTKISVDDSTHMDALRNFFLKHKHIPVYMQSPTLKFMITGPLDEDARCMVAEHGGIVLEEHLFVMAAPTSSIR